MKDFCGNRVFLHWDIVDGRQFLSPSFCIRLFLSVNAEEEEKNAPGPPNLVRGERWGAEMETWFLITDERANVCAFEVFLLIQWVLT